MIESKYVRDPLEIRALSLYSIMNKTGIADYIFKNNYDDWADCFTPLGRIIDITRPYIKELGYVEQPLDGFSYWKLP